MYEYKYRPSYHRPWHHRVPPHSSNPPPNPRRRTQSSDPFTRRNLSHHENVLIGEKPTVVRHTPTTYCSRARDTLQNKDGTSEHSEINLKPNQDNDKMSGEEIDQILYHIRRSRSAANNTCLDQGTRLSAKRPDPPKISPPQLPRTTLQDFNSEYQRAPGVLTGRNEEGPNQSRRSRSRRVTIKAKYQKPLSNNNLNTYDKIVVHTNPPPICQNTAQLASNGFLSSTQKRSLPQKYNGNKENEKSDRDKAQTQKPLTEEEIVSILETHRQRRVKNESAFKKGSSRSPSVTNRNTRDAKSSNNLTTDTTAMPTLVSVEQVNNKPTVYHDTAHPNNMAKTYIPRSRLNSNPPQILSSREDNNNNRNGKEPPKNSSKFANIQNQFSNIDVAANDGHAKVCRNKEHTDDSYTNSKPTCVGVGNLNTKSTIVIDHNTHALLPEKPNKEVKCDAGKNTSRDVAITSNPAESLDTIKNSTSDINDNVEPKTKTNGPYEFLTSNSSSPSTENEQKHDGDEDDSFNIKSCGEFEWNTNPTYTSSNLPSNIKNDIDDISLCQQNQQHNLNRVQSTSRQHDTNDQECKTWDNCDDKQNNSHCVNGDTHAIPHRKCFTAQNKSDEEKVDNNNYTRGPNQDSIHSNFNFLLKNMYTDGSNDGVDINFGKIETDEGDKEVEEVVRNLRQRLDNMGDYLDRVKEAAMKLTDNNNKEVKQSPEDIEPPETLDYEVTNPETKATKSEHTEETFSFADVDSNIASSVANESGSNAEDKSQFVPNNLPSFMWEPKSYNNDYAYENYEDIDTSATITIPIIKPYASVERTPEPLIDECEEETVDIYSANELDEDLVASKNLPTCDEHCLHSLSHQGQLTETVDVYVKR